MKKFASLILALAMTFSLCISASAANPETLSGSGLPFSTSAENGKVTVTVSDNSTTMVYNVEVSWGDLTFTYNVNANSGTWDPELHKYSNDSSSAGWVNEGGDTIANLSITRNNAITIINHSNAPINIAVAPNDADAEDIYTVTFNGATSLPSAEGHEKANAEAADDAALIATYSVTVAASSEPSVTPGGPIAAATVTISAV